MNRIAVFRITSLVGYFGLLFLIPLWHLVIDPLPPELVSYTLLIQAGPLLFALRGILHGRPYTHAWASFLALIYFIAGISFASDETRRTFGLIVTVLSLVFFIGCVFYARYMGRHLKSLESE